MGIESDMFFAMLVLIHKKKGGKQNLCRVLCKSMRLKNQMLETEKSGNFLCRDWEEAAWARSGWQGSLQVGRGGGCETL